MKCLKYLFVLICCFSTTYVYAYQADTTNYQEKAEKLKHYFQKSFNNPDSLKYRRLFFEAFPNSFSELDSLYGYHNGKKGLLYEEGVNHIIKLFDNIKCINDSVYYSKLIHISIGGSWKADAVNYFQSILHQHSLAKPELLFTLLGNYSKAKIQSFFYFFYHGSHPPFEEIPAEFKNMKTEYPRIYLHMKKGFKSAQTDSGH